MRGRELELHDAQQAARDEGDGQVDEAGPVREGRNPHGREAEDHEHEPHVVAVVAPVDVVQPVDALLDRDPPVQDVLVHLVRVQHLADVRARALDQLHLRGLVDPLALGVVGAVEGEDDVVWDVEHVYLGVQGSGCHLDIRHYPVRWRAVD